MSGFSLEIDWDPKKADANISKHRVAFLIAATVLRDPLSITVRDQVQVVVHTWNEIDETRAKARMISARQATGSERRVYEEGQ